MPLLTDVQEAYLGTTPVDQIRMQDQKVWPALPYWFGPGNDPGALDSCNVQYEPWNYDLTGGIGTTVTTTDGVSHIEWTGTSALTFAMWGLTYPGFASEQEVRPHIYDGEQVVPKYTGMWMANKVALGPGQLESEWAVIIGWYSLYYALRNTLSGGLMEVSSYGGMSFKCPFNNPEPKFMSLADIGAIPLPSPPPLRWSVMLIYWSSSSVYCPPGWIDIDWKGTKFAYGNPTDPIPALPGAA